MLVDNLLKLFASQAQQAQGSGAQPWGSGHTINTSGGPHVVKCAGKEGPNPDLATDPTVEPTIFIQHKLGELQAPPGHDIIAFPLRDENGVAISNIPDDAWFTPEPGVTLDPNNLVCPFCGQPPVM